MATSLSSSLRSTRILKLLPVLSSFCIIVGVAWLLLLPLEDYSRKTYISENALLPGQVHTYFGGSEQNVFRAYRNEVSALGANSSASGEMAEKIGEIFEASGLKVGRQRYSYTAAGEEYHGENVYAVLQAPRGDATEALVLCAGWLNMDGQLNESGVALVLTLARYLKRWSLWSKDIIFLITSDSRAGPQAWVDAYHDLHNPPSVASLPLKSGAIQGVVVVDYPSTRSFESLHIVYDGINGQLPNLDLINTAVRIASGQMGVRTTLQEMWNHNDKYQDRLRTMLRGMVNQGLGHASGPHSSFIPYHIDAITLQAYGEGRHDEVTLGRTVESLFRSLNNLLEHFHQSFFFYLLMASRVFVSIGTYLPSAMLIAVNFTFAAIGLWVESGKEKSPARSKLSSAPPYMDYKIALYCPYRVHSPPTDKHPCEAIVMYDREVQLQHLLREHIRHLQCGICGLRFGGSYELRRHQTRQPHICTAKNFEPVSQQVIDLGEELTRCKGEFYNVLYSQDLQGTWQKRYDFMDVKKNPLMTAEEDTNEQSLLVELKTSPLAAQVSEERPMLLPLAFVIIVHSLGFIPLYIFNNLDEKYFTPVFYAFGIFNVFFPPILSTLFTISFNITSIHFKLIKCFSLLTLGMFLSALATLNFSLSFLIGLFAVPFTFIRPFPEKKWTAGVVSMILLQGLTPTAALVGVAYYWGEPLSSILKEAAFGWHVWGMWTQVVVWCVWWPAWVTVGVLAAASWNLDVN